MNFPALCCMRSLQAPFYGIPPFIVAGYLIGIVPGIKEYLPYIMGAIILLVTTLSVIRIIRVKSSGKPGKDLRKKYEAGIQATSKCFISALYFDGRMAAFN